MRDKLAKVEGNRGSFIATFKRFGRKPGWKGREETTILLVDVKDAAGNEACDHVWFTCGKGWSALGLSAGDRVAFDARVAPYWKGYGAPEEKERDYKLSHPTKLRLITPADVADLPLFGNVRNPHFKAA